MTFHILSPTENSKSIDITKRDIKFNTTEQQTNVILLETTPNETIKKLKDIKFESGDVICLAGLCPRQTTFSIIEIAKERKENYMPGLGVDHRGVAIPPGKFKNRLPIEKNYQVAWPYLAVIGDPVSAIASFELLEYISPLDYWPEYTPEVPNITHLLAVLSSIGGWITPDWFKVVDLSIRDLELAPIMYSSHAWHDWIAFYPANRTFKLENHSQLNPVWLANSEKPMDYWKHD